MNALRILVLVPLLVILCLCAVPSTTAAVSFHLEAVDAVGDVGTYTSLALDSQGWAHVAYFDVTNTDLKYAVQTPLGWSIETVDSISDVGRYASLELDGDGNPHISYHDFILKDLKYAKKEAGVWFVETVDSVNDVGRETSLAVDAAGDPHIIYMLRGAIDDLKYAVKRSGAWTIETVDAAGIAGYQGSIALDAAGVPHVSSHTYIGCNCLRYAVRTGGVWTVETVEGGGNFTSIAVDELSRPHISYTNSSPLYLKYAVKSGGVWTIETVDASSASLGQRGSLALDRDGNACISYYDVTNGDLKYAVKSGGLWTTQVVDSGGDVGDYTSLALVNGASPRITYYDITNGDLKIAYTDFVAPADPGLCVATPTPCVTVPVILDRGAGPDARSISVTVVLSPELELCDTAVPANSITQGPWLDGYLSAYQVVDEGGGIYTVDQSILGLPCGVADGDTLFWMDVTGSGADGTGTITVTEVSLRDCGNPFAELPCTPGPAASIRVDFTAPAVVTDLAGTQVKTGNDSDGTTEIDLAWTAPAETDVATVELYRKGFGYYPEYDDDGGAAPSVPADPTAAVAAGWIHVVSLAGAASAYTDEPATRDYWYYAAFVVDNCDNISGVSNRTDGTLNYHLGDVAVSPGDNLVAGVDISAMGAAYGTVHGGGLYDPELDVGPTSDNSTDALPTTDNAIQFEDLIIMAINYGMVSKPGARPEAADRNEIALRVVPSGATIEAVVRLASDGAIQGVSVPLVWNAAAVEPVEMIPGEFGARQGAPALVVSPRAGAVDAAVFGATFAGEGDLARITFRVLAAGDPGIALGDVVARDGENRRVDLELTKGIGGGVLPVTTRLLPCAPNPFRSASMISFALAENGRVTVRVYAVDGRLVRTLVESVLPAGEHSVQWDGRDDGGRPVAAGTYVVRLEASDTVQSHRVVRIR